MKKYFLCFAMIAMGLMACTNDENEDGDFKAADVSLVEESEVSDEIKEFFDTEFGFPLRGLNFFGRTHENICYIVNSAEELKSIYKGELELPAIDFNRYSLIVGQQGMNDAYHIATRMEIQESPTHYLLNVYTPKLDVVLCALSEMYYWTLCSKIANKEVQVNVVFYEE